METQTLPMNPAERIFVVLIALFNFGFFVGLSDYLWLLLIAGWAALWVCTSEQREAERKTFVPKPDRPWRKE